jgi:hypothetical protein
MKVTQADQEHGDAFMAAISRLEQINAHNATTQMMLARILVAFTLHKKIATMSLHPVSDQRAVPCMLMRGGTSRGPFFLESDLPATAPRATACCWRPWVRPIRARSMAWAAPIR